MKEKLLKIINHYEINHQLRKFNEETFELIEAIMNYEFNTSGMDKSIDCDVDVYEREYTEHIAEEIADVMVLLEQFKLYYEITNEDVEKIMKEKIERQLKRMENE